MGLLPAGADILPPSDDRVFKLILTAQGAEPILMDLISAIIKQPVAGVIVCNNELPPEDTREKAERLDVNCRLRDGTQVDLEMQASRIQEDSEQGHQNLNGKSIYYLCDLHSSQSSRGVRRYDRLARTYQVTFCTYNVFHNRTEYVNSFSLRHDADGELLSDAIHIIYIELNKLWNVLKKPVDDMTDLEKWSIFFKYANKRRYRRIVNRVIESKEELQMAGELLMNISKDERERAVLRSRRMYQTDLQSDLATAEDRGERRGMHKGRQEGMRKGRQEGMRKGRQEGMRKSTLEFARALKADNVPIEKIIQYTGLSKNEIEDL